MIASKFGIGQQVRHSLLGYLGGRGYRPGLFAL